MIIGLLITGLIISIGFNVTSFLLIRILLKKNSIHEQWILDFKQDVINTLATMRLIDDKGTFATSVNNEGKFEADDQVGQSFKELMDLIVKLNDRTT